MPQLTLQELISTRPSLHRYGDGRVANWGVSESVLRFIADNAKPGMRTIETGAGLSTVAFTLSGAEHHAVFPEPYLLETVPEYLDQHGVARNNLHFHNGPSQDVLPGLDLDGFDMALIDGEHAFPLPFLDWYYLAKRMKPGALLIIDDTQIWTGAVLRTFLACEPEWRLVKEVYGTVMFRMEAPWVEKWWAKQTYTVLHSQITPEAVPYLPEHALAALAPIYNEDARS
jgi:hypothetical protein